ncbi:MAG: asparagine N-glycosylation enzyme membrane subunit Stt3 [Candidatus Omnitrophota bacterium]|jgi:asparagine N-glycosylation enzyme membrane subunit Stt3
MGVILGFVVFVLNILAIFDIVKGNHDTVKKVLWILLIIFLPVLGLVLYYLLGRSA